MKKADFEEKAISPRTMTSHQICASSNEANFENLLKLTVDEFCEKFVIFAKNSLFGLINLCVTPRPLWGFKR